MQVRCAKCGITFDAAADEEPLCPVCRRFGTATGSPAPRLEEPLASEDQANQCTVHPGNVSQWVCDRCGNFMCTLCAIRVARKRVCPTCFDLLYGKDKVFVQRATLSERLGAVLLDGLILLIIWIVVTIVFSSIALFGEPGPYDSGELEILLTWLTVLGLWAFYNVTMWTFSGATLGKKATKIKIVAADQKPPSLLRSLVRFAIFSVAPTIFILGCIQPLFFFVLPAFLTGYLWAAWEKKKRAWHDLIAGTEVIKARKK